MKIICGGQTGVDRAALDVARECRIAYGGWCPRGGWAEDYPVPPGLLVAYPELRETPLADPSQRTLWNVRDADACLIIVDTAGIAISRGTALARERAEQNGKPVLVVDLQAPDAAQRVALWLGRQREAFGPALSLAIGGPRESESPGVYGRALTLLRTVLPQTIC
jgi:hypothetical protein